VREEEVETQLLKFITNNKGLHTLILNYSRLRCQFGKGAVLYFTLHTRPGVSLVRELFYALHNTQYQVSVW